MAGYQQKKLYNKENMPTMTYDNIINVDDLHEILDQENLIIVDVRFNLNDTEWGRGQYNNSHIPRAQYAHLDKDLSAQIINGVTGRHPWPSINKIESLLSTLGINHSSQVVIYDQHHGGIAARFWAMCLHVGLENAAVLNGGWEAWNASSNKTSSKKVDITPTQFTARKALLDIVDVHELDLYDCVIDARATPRYLGIEEPIDPVAGHIPGALSLPFLDNLNADRTWKTKSEIQERFSPYQSSKAVIYCGSGVTACHHLLALKYAGYPLANIYGGSWSHYITDSKRQVATKTT